jgi:hypothetical protein
MDINVDPNRVTEGTITGNLIYPAAADETGTRRASGDFQTLERWLGYWASSGSFAIDVPEATYNEGPGFANTLWGNQYGVLFDLHQAEVKGLANQDTLTAGASIIMSAMLWQDMVDLFGDIPYSQTFNLADYPLPAYDKGQNVYNDLQKRLDLAITYMSTPGTHATAFTAIDIVNHGDRTKWIKYANTLKLRLLMHQSEINGFDPTAELTNIQNNGGVLEAGETVSVNPGYTNATGQQSPFYAGYGFTVVGSDANSGNKANSYFVNLLKANNDPRLTKFFDPLAPGNTVVGNVFGLAAGNPLNSSKVGSGLAKSADQDQWLMTDVESLFLECEAIQRGWLPGDAATKYAEAITASFTFLNVPDATTKAATYISSFPYDGTIQNTLFQKYIALCGIAPVEVYSDLRRIGYDILPASVGGVPWFSVNTGVISDKLPVRFPYPQSEFTINAANVAAVGPVDNFTSKIFWDVN